MDLFGASPHDYPTDEELGIEPDRDYFREALAIAAGTSRLIPERAHLEALVWALDDLR
jgi:hypothetical protein